MNIYEYLKKDHKEVSKLFKKIIAEKNGSTRERLFLEIKMKLELHADSEDKTFYKALSKAKKGEEDAAHGEEEHKEIKKALAKLSKIPVKETVKWCVQLGELKQIVEHHVEDEEGKMFKDAKNIISDEQAVELAEDMKLLKQAMISTKKFTKLYGSSKKILS